MLATLLIFKRLSIFFSDETEDYAAISVQGPKSRDVLSCLMSCDDEKELSNTEFPYSSSKLISLNLTNNHLKDILSMRVTFVGELGYELYVPNSMCEQVVSCLISNEKGIKVSSLKKIYVNNIILILNSTF